MSKMESKTNISRRLKRFDGMTGLTLTPIFYDRSTPLLLCGSCPRRRRSTAARILRSLCHDVCVCAWVSMLAL